MFDGTFDRTLELVAVLEELFEYGEIKDRERINKGWVVSFGDGRFMRIVMCSVPEYSDHFVYEEFACTGVKNGEEVGGFMTVREQDRGLSIEDVRHDIIKWSRSGRGRLPLYG